MIASRVDHLFSSLIRSMMALAGERARGSGSPSFIWRLDSLEYGLGGRAWGRLALSRVTV